MVATFQVLRIHVWLVATALDSALLDISIIHSPDFKCP